MRIAAGVGLVAVLAAGMMVQSSSAQAATGKVCNARKYGAKADGITKDTKAIQAAIDDCTRAKGGGTVMLSGGTFLSAPIVLKDNVTLEWPRRHSAWLARSRRLSAA